MSVAQIESLVNAGGEINLTYAQIGPDEYKFEETVSGACGTIKFDESTSALKSKIFALIESQQEAKRKLFEKNQKPVVEKAPTLKKKRLTSNDGRS